MKLASVIVVATASTLFLGAAGWRGDRPLDARTAHLRAEVARLRAHFDSVDTELRARDVSHLSPQQRASRTRLIGWLREYRDASQFPENDKFANEAVPFFRDSRGTLCAMAYLVDRSGRGDIVDHIAKARNNAFIHELTDDGALVAWVDASGLSVSEAARIQPAYEGGPCCSIPDGNISDDLGAKYVLASAAFGGTSLGAAAFNLFSPSRASAAVGLLSGVGSVVTGGVYLNDGGDRRKLATANVAVGSIAVIAGVRALLASRSASPSAPVQSTKRELLTDAAIAPDVIVSSNASRFGLRMQARF